MGLTNDMAIGPLHGIPYGLKDIISVPHYKTTWGSKTFKHQVLDIEAWVYKRCILKFYVCFFPNLVGSSFLLCNWSINSVTG